MVKPLEEQIKIKVCIGSSCHLKGSRIVIQTFQNQIEKHNLQDVIQMSGQFCMKNCQNGVCIMIDDKAFSVNPAEADSFFEKEIITRVKVCND